MHLNRVCAGESEESGNESSDSNTTMRSFDHQTEWSWDDEFLTTRDKIGWLMDWYPDEYRMGLEEMYEEVREAELAGRDARAHRRSNRIVERNRRNRND